MHSVTLKNPLKTAVRCLQSLACREAGRKLFAVALPEPAVEEMVGAASENCESITSAVPREWSMVRTQSSELKSLMEAFCYLLTVQSHVQHWL